METKLTNEEIIRLQKIADKLQFAGYGGSLQNQRSAGGDVKMLRKIIAIAIDGKAVQS